MGAALVASLALGDDHTDNRIWRASLLQTFSWIVSHDIGWAGTNLESGLPGYWDVSMSNLYTAAACLNNAQGIDFRGHPAFAEATWYPVMKEATVPPASAPFDRPYPKEVKGLWGIIQHKPVELPSAGFGGPWWYDYAAQFPQSPAAYFITKQFGRVENPHQEGHFELMDVLWVRTLPKPKFPPTPTLLFKATDREAMFRSGYGSPHTYLSFNGDCFLSARNEVLGCTSGLAWHFPWHQWAVTESALETEGHPFSPSMSITNTFDSPRVSASASKSGTSNVRYYPRPEQARSYREYETRTRDIFYIRSERPSLHDYFLFVDRVAQRQPCWHAFNWHIWNHPGNAGSYDIVDAHTVRVPAERLAPPGHSFARPDDLRTTTHSLAAHRQLCFRPQCPAPQSYSGPAEKIGGTRATVTGRRMVGWGDGPNQRQASPAFQGLQGPSPCPYRAFELDSRGKVPLESGQPKKGCLGRRQYPVGSRCRASGRTGAFGPQAGGEPHVPRPAALE